MRKSDMPGSAGERGGVSEQGATTESSKLPPWVDGALEEYRAHRAGFLAAQEGAQRTLAFGATTVGILVAGAFNVWRASDPLPATLLFLVVIPLVSTLVI